jgi:glycosyltransferase involved in cell wall biosynthesis
MLILLFVGLLGSLHTPTTTTSQTHALVQKNSLCHNPTDNQKQAKHKTKPKKQTNLWHPQKLHNHAKTKKFDLLIKQQFQCQQFSLYPKANTNIPALSRLEKVHCMDKFRLAVFNTQPPHLYLGGVERRIMETTKRLTNQADITVYSGTKAGFQTPTIINGVQFVPCHSTDRLYPLDNWIFNRNLLKTGGVFDADVFEAHNVSGYGFPRALKKQGIKKPFIQVIHGVLADEYEQAKTGGRLSLRGRAANHFMGYLAKLEKQTSEEATLIITISNYSLQKMQKHYGVDPKKVRIVPNGVDIEKFKPTTDVEAARRKLGLCKEPVVLFVGSLIPRKGLSFLVEAAQKVVKEQEATKFLVVGDGPQKTLLENSISKANLSGNFKFLSKINEEALPTLYNCADVFVLPSIQEGQGIVLLEAEASGVPVVAFVIGGVNEAVKNGETGLLVERGDAEALADGLLKVLGDSALRERMGIAGRRFVAEKFTWDLCARRMLAIYHEALSI